MSTVRAVRADITALEVDAVVNAANETLQHGGGVAAAISRAAGPALQMDSDTWVREHGPLSPGAAAVTTAGEMPARMVVHVVGPRYREGQDNEGMLEAAVKAALGAAAQHGARSVALPAISAGIFGYPRPDATRVIARTVNSWLAANPQTVETVFLVGYDAPATADFERALAASPPAENQN